MGAAAKVMASIRMARQAIQQRQTQRSGQERPEIRRAATTRRPAAIVRAIMTTAATTRVMPISTAPQAQPKWLGQQRRAATPKATMTMAATARKAAEQRHPQRLRQQA